MRIRNDPSDHPSQTSVIVAHGNGDLDLPGRRQRRYANGFSVMPQSDNGARMVSELCNQSDLVALRLQA